MNPDALFFRLANELPPTVEAAYAKWKAAQESNTLQNEILNTITTNKAHAAMVELKDRPTEKPSKTKESIKVETEKKSGIICPICEDVLVRYNVCSGCELGAAGIKYSYRCSCGIVVYTKEKL